MLSTGEYNILFIIGSKTNDDSNNAIVGAWRIKNGVVSIGFIPIPLPSSGTTTISSDVKNIPGKTKINNGHRIRNEIVQKLSFLISFFGLIAVVELLEFLEPDMDIEVLVTLFILRSLVGEEVAGVVKPFGFSRLMLVKAGVRIGEFG